jgi:hypothetical protein
MKEGVSYGTVLYSTYSYTQHSWQLPLAWGPNKSLMSYSGKGGINGSFNGKRQQILDDFNIKWEVLRRSLLGGRGGGGHVDLYPVKSVLFSKSFKYQE